jgi:anthranilate/para-aminobenzoate synthase component I
MNFSRKSIALYVGLVFVCGGVLGVFGDRLYTVTTVTKAKNARPTPEEFRRGYLAFMQKRLGLNEQQVTSLGLILDETRARMNEVNQRTIPEQKEIQKTQTAKIRALLTPAQQSEYEVVIKERREKMKKGGSRGGPGGF